MTYILMDIEGTTTPIHFVHKVLFPYAAKHLASFIHDHKQNPQVELCLQQVITTAREETGLTIDQDEAIHLLRKWIDEDRKHPALKELQGMIWENGYQQGAFTSQLFDDVLPAWQAWQAKGIRLGIYSSGSVKAQKLLFAHTPHGDLTPMLSHYFDTKVGAKQESKSYETIAQNLECDAQNILFLSDVPKELDAAKAAGMKTIHVVREETVACDHHPTVTTFADITP